MDSKRLGNIWNPYIEFVFSSTRYTTIFKIHSNCTEIVSRRMIRVALIYCISFSEKKSQTGIFDLSIINTIWSDLISSFYSYNANRGKNMDYLTMIGIDQSWSISTCPVKKF